ncbi:hypothetical protein H1P_530023 [Hyella patelloides LEGE 07179]|uniref:Uncharacterized protein n=1 Tax=Hyella patelloides LEGE 07179 TaxID=945734 RepID=A0A563W0I9_9CYAN|nr:hypothetical protein H1P_530023 [Hyella patelloides LEGE 07179]
MTQKMNGKHLGDSYRQLSSKCSKAISQDIIQSFKVLNIFNHDY